MSPESHALLPLAESIADGSAIDWNAIEAAVTPDERAVVRELRVLASLAVLHRSLPAEPSVSSSKPQAITRPAIGAWGHLDLLERLGGGTFGEVYRAWDRQLEREVALKLLRTSDVVGNPQTSRIAMEGRLLAQLRHPNVITVYGVATHDDRVGLWMELVRGATLEQILQKHGAFSAREAALVGIDLCRALAAVHAAGFIHRDVKAQNVMRESGGRTVLMDLGTGRESRPERPHVTADLAGTPLYLAPEIFDGAPASARTDLYSLGVLLYRLVTGAFPARVRTMEELRAVHAKGSGVGLRDARADLPTPFVRVIDRAIERAPERRYESAGALEADLARALDEEPGSVRVQPDDSGTLRLPSDDPGSVRLQPDYPRAITDPAWWRPAAVAAAIVAVVALGGIYWTAIRKQPSTPAAAPGAVAAPIRSIAVLPLENLTGDISQEYFADGMTDELISTLGRIEGLNVISRTSVVQFKNSRTPLAQIAEMLKVDGFLEGSVLFVPASGSGNGGQPERVRINVRLLRAGTDSQILNRTFEAVLSDVLSLQSQIATAVAGAIQLELTSQQQQSLAARPQDPDALDLYLRGRYYWNQRTEEGLKRSIQYFQEAINRDPRNAAAHAGLADAYTLLGIRGFTPWATASKEAYAAATKALEIDGSVAEAHASIALVYMARLEWKTAETSFERAIELKPGYASAHHWYSSYLSQHERLAEARVAIERAVALDPLSVSVNSHFGWILLLARQYDDAIAQLQKALQLDPKAVRPHMALAEAYAGKRDYQRALAAANAAASLGAGAPEPRAYLGCVLVLAGRRTEGLKIAEELAERYRANLEGGPVLIATIYASARENDRAFEWLDRALSARDPWLGYIKIDPRFDNLRADPRYGRLLASIGLAR